MYHSVDHAILSWTETQSAQTTPTSPMDFRRTRLEKLSTQLCSSTWRPSREKSGSVPSVVCVCVSWWVWSAERSSFPGGCNNGRCRGKFAIGVGYCGTAVLRCRAGQAIQSLQGALERVRSSLYQGHLGSATMAPLQTALERYVLYGRSECFTMYNWKGYK